MDVTTKTVIVVEDEPLVAMMIEEMLADIGWQSIGPALNEAEALVLIKKCRPNAALLDVLLGGTTSLAIAASCRTLNIPVVFVTGLDVTNLPQGCDGAPVLAKPFSLDELDRVLVKLH